MKFTLLLLGVIFLIQNGEAFVSTTPSLSTRTGVIIQRESSTKDSSNHAVRQEEEGNYSFPRRAMFQTSAVTSFAVLLMAPLAAQAQWILDEETGDYVEVEDVDWQTAWKERLDKASTMTSDEIFAAARGAGNNNSNNSSNRKEEESPASRKRRALSACRNATLRSQAAAGTEQECTARVLNGKEVDFILDGN